VRTITARFRALRLNEATAVRRGDEVVVLVPGRRLAGPEALRLGQRAGLYLYDWEANLIDPETGRPAGPRGEAGTSFYVAVLGAARRPPVARSNDTTGGEYFLVGSGQVLAGPAPSPDALVASAPPGARGRPGVRLVKVNPGTVVVRATSDLGQARYYVLNDDPALDGGDVVDPRQEFDNGPGGGGEPIVTMRFTAAGRRRFHDVTRRVAQRGVLAQVPGRPPETAFQHFAIVVGDRALSLPYIDFNQNPDGIDARSGAQISGGFTISSAQDLARLLKAGSLAVPLTLVSVSRVAPNHGI
jgi:SecD/SecF fusion protein